MPKSIDLTGRTFGRLYVVGPAPPAPGRRLWLCRCTCGRTTTPSTGNLNVGNSTSCGTCTRVEAMRKNRPATTRPDQAWRPEEIAVLGRHADAEVARLIGRTRQAVTQKRRALGIEPRLNRRFRWTAETVALLGTATDEEVARRLGCPVLQASRKRRALGIPPHGGLTDLTCEFCGRPFVGAKGRRHCSIACLDAVVRAGKYRHAHAARAAEAEMAMLAAKLERRLSTTAAEAPHAQRP